MNLLAASVVALTARMLVSLAIVLAVIAVAYAVMRRRQGGGLRSTRTPRRAVRLARAGRTARSTGRAHTAGLEVVGRVGLSRGSAAVAVRFGERVILLSAGDTGATTVVADMPGATWDALHEVREPIEFPARQRGVGTESRPGFVEALRQATARRAG